MKNHKNNLDSGLLQFPTLHEVQQYQENVKLTASNNTQKLTTTDWRIHQINNFVGMMLEQLRYCCQALKDDVIKDRVDMLEQFREVTLSMREIGDKIQQSDGRNKQPTYRGREDTSQLEKQNKALRIQNHKLKQIMSSVELNYKSQIQKINQQSYQVFQQNFVLNQKVVSLESELLNKNCEVIEDLKRQHQISAGILQHQIQSMEQTLREKQQNISILQRLVKEYQVAQDRKSVRNQDDHSKVLNMLSMESHQSKRKDLYFQKKQSLKNSEIREKYNMNRDSSSKGLNFGAIAQLRPLDTSAYNSVSSPTNGFNSQFNRGFGYHQSPISVHSQSATHLNPAVGQYMSQYPSNQISSYYDRQDPYSSMSQYPSAVPPRPQKQTLGSRMRNQVSIHNYSSKGTLSHQSSSQHLRGDQRKQRREMKRQGSRQFRHQSGRDNKIDLAKIEHELQGLAKELKNELQTISYKK